MASHWQSKLVVVSVCLEDFCLPSVLSPPHPPFLPCRSLDTAKQQELLSGYQVHLTASLKPERRQMADIIKCSGGEPVDFVPSISPGERVLVVSCEEDSSACQGCAEAGVPVYSTELILGGVLRQQLDLDQYPQLWHMIHAVAIQLVVARGWLDRQTLSLSDETWLLLTACSHNCIDLSHNCIDLPRSWLMMWIEF